MGLVDVLHIVQVSATWVLQLDESVGDIAAVRDVNWRDVLKAW